MCSTLRHRALAQAIGRAKEARKAKDALDAGAFLQQQVADGASKISKMKTKKQENAAKIKSLEEAGELERAAKIKAEAFVDELSAVCSGLRHRALAYIIRQAKERKRTLEAQALSAKLAADVSQGEAQISDLQQQKSAANQQIAELER